MRARRAAPVVVGLLVVACGSGRNPEPSMPKLASAGASASPGPAASSTPKPGEAAGASYAAPTASGAARWWGSPYKQAPFRMHQIASRMLGGYQVVAADMNKDGKLDIVALGVLEKDLVWFENPYWTRHVLYSGADHMINIDAMDVDGDGIPEIGLAYEFNTNPNKSVGKVGILKANGNPKAPWSLKEIDAISTSHRVRFVDIGGQKMLVNAPVLNAKVREVIPQPNSPRNGFGFGDPDHLGVPLRVYRYPQWKVETINEANLGAMHALFMVDWDNDGRQDVMTAAYTGVAVQSLKKDGTWTRTEVVKGNPAEWPQCGASEVAVGRFAGKKFFATNEPFHGNQVVVYQDTGGGWSRNVIEDDLVMSHALILLDSDGDGSDEIVSSGTGKPGVFLYKATDRTGKTWERMVVDPDLAANGCITADLNNDHKDDIVCIDATKYLGDVRWYENIGK